MKKYFRWQLLAVLIAALILGLFDAPQSFQQKLGLPEFISTQKYQLGLDLQGGSQLDYKVDLRKVPEADRANIVEGVKGVIEKRVNGLGVSEPNIYVSDMGGEQHIIVELAENAVLTQEDVDTYLGNEKVLADLNDDEKKQVSLEKAKAVVGKTIQLEFKEEKTSVDPEEKDKIKQMAQAALDRIKGGADYSVVAQEEEQAYPGKVTYEKSEYIFAENLPAAIKDALLNLEIGEYTDSLIESGGSFILNESGQAIEDTSLNIIKLVDQKEEIKNEKEVDARHILIAWKGAERAEAGVTRNEEEAYTLAQEIVGKLKAGDSFTELAKEYSDDASNKETGGVLETPVTGDGTYAFDFEEAAMSLKGEKELYQKPVKTNFGYHIIRADAVRSDVMATQYKYESLSYSTTPDPWKETGLTGEHFVHADIQLDNFYQPYVTIQFNDEGAKLFEEITEANVGKRIAIFVGGEFISAPRVNEKIAGGSAQINGQFTMEEAENLARDLNTGAIPAPVVLTGEYTIGATLGQDALNKSLWAGIIGLILVMAFMLWKYRLAGLVADAALGIFAIILLFLIKSQLSLGVSIVAALVIFGFLVYKILNSKDPAWEKTLAFILSCVAFLFITFLLKTAITTTLAGVAGIIMSIGMAVDANILIFERFKEELREGKTYKAALESGFDRAWNSIRDSNFSTLLTAVILFYFGSSLIKGFAFNLAAGIVVSMFTAVTITRTLMKGFVGTKIAENPKAFGINLEEKEPNFKFIAKSKLWFTISGGFFGVAILAMVVFGFNLGLDFTGGSLVEYKFKEPVTKEFLAENLSEIEGEIEGETNTAEEVVPPPETAPIPSEEGEVVLETETEIAEENAPLDLTNIQILESGENSFIVKSKYISAENHDLLTAKMEKRFPESQELRFTTIGPLLGQTMLSKAIKAILIAVVMMIIYIAFAFRKVPKEVSAWRFGACAIVALIHDVVIVTGLFIILSEFLNVEVDALFVTAMLTVFGYSVNDTIVVFDRMRENLLHEKDENLSTVADKALNQTLTRSLYTAFPTILALIAILIFGSASIFYFILALTLGIIFGTYSSLFTATPLLVMWNNWITKRKQ